MNKANNSKASLIMVGVGGLALGILLTFFLLNNAHQVSDSSADKEEPLYWVAPMDANYRRDKPGKSPMGMDLIPVYDDGTNTAENSPGTVTISPDVVNNLGVRIAPVVRQALQSEIVTVGYVKYDENKLVHIHPRVSGWVEKLFVTAAGDVVEKAAPLYSLYSPELVNAQEELMLAVNRNNERLIEASENRLRALQIPTEFIANLKRTRKIQQTVNFYAPQSGVVDNLNIREGFFVQPGTTILSIGALDQVWVEAEIFERQASLVNLGDPVTMTLGYLPGRTWTGKVDYIYPTLDLATRTVRLRLQFDNPDRRLKPNMFAQITVHTDSNDRLLVIPREALIRTGDQNRVVLALGDGRFKSIEVNTGRSDQRYVEILSGLSEGEKIVSSAQFLLDSESSKTSDFKRMHHAKDELDTAWVAAEIISQALEQQKVIVSHDAIDTWDMPAMTMSYRVSPNVDIDTLRPGTKLHMQARKRVDGSFEIADVHIMTQGSVNKSKAQSERDNEGVHPEQTDLKEEKTKSLDQQGMDQSSEDHSSSESVDQHQHQHQHQNIDVGE